MEINLSQVLEAYRRTTKRIKKKKVHSDEVQDWTQLKEGDTIRSIRTCTIFCECLWR